MLLYYIELLVDHPHGVIVVYVNGNCGVLSYIQWPSEWQDRNKSWWHGNSSQYAFPFSPLQNIFFRSMTFKVSVYRKTGLTWFGPAFIRLSGRSIGRYTHLVFLMHSQSITRIHHLDDHDHPRCYRQKSSCMPCLAMLIDLYLEAFRTANRYACFKLCYEAGIGGGEIKFLFHRAL